MDSFHLDEIALGTSARILAINEGALNASEARRLSEFGFEIGAVVEPLHRAGLFARDPIAVRVGRMTIALRRAVAAAIEVERA